MRFSTADLSVVTCKGDSHPLYVDLGVVKGGTLTKQSFLEEVSQLTSHVLEAPHISTDRSPAGEDVEDVCTETS
jgi:hypothetical protein